MGELWLWVTSKFGVKYVVLTDQNGCVEISPIFWKAGRAFARWGYLTDCRLLVGGKVGGPFYVESWEPYAPFKSKRPPIPAEVPKASASGEGAASSSV